MTRDQTLRLSLGANRFNSLNQGVGQYDLRRARVRFAAERLQLHAAGSRPARPPLLHEHAVLRQPQQVAAALQGRAADGARATTSSRAGGAQQAGGRRSASYTLSSDLDYVKGKHSWRAGISLDGYHYRSDEAQNYLGTYTFATLDDFNAGKPRSYTRRIGDPLIDYFNLQAAFYLQDDVRIRKNLTITPGVRYEAQTHLDDYNNLDAARRHHVGAVQERQDHAALELRHFL